MAGIPLSALLALQVIIVAAAFTAAITVLSEQQRSEFKNALDKQLSLQRASALNAVTSPLLQRKELFKTYVKQYLNGQNNNKQFFAPSDEVGTTENFSHVMEFYKHFYILPVTDPIIQIITFSNESAHVYPDYLAGGAKNKTAISGPGAPQHIIWNIWVADAMKVAYVKNEILVACISPYPADPATCPMFSQYLDTVTTMAHPVEYSRPMMWGVPGLVPDPGVPGTYSKILSFAMTVDTSARPYSMLGVSFSLNHVKPLIYATVATTSSKTAVYTNFYRYQYGWKEYMLITGKTDFDDFNVEAYLAAGEDMYYASWRGGKTPDKVLNAVFFEAQHMFQNQTASGTFELKHDGKDYFVSAARVLDHESGLDWLLTEYTPREEFFGASDRARLTGVLIGVLGALVVLVTCILIWLAIRVPLRSLHAGMDLAADMRNDEVVHISPVLSEIRDLNSAFRQMNSKLLAARPFLPQSLLHANLGDTEEEENNNQVEDDYGTTDGDKIIIDGAIISPTQSESTVRSSQRDAGSPRRVTSSRMKSTDNQSTDLSSAAQRKIHGKKHGFQREMEYRRVAILSINVLNFHSCIAALGGGQAPITAVHGALARIVELATGEERGIVDYFHGDRFVCGFNTARLCGNGARNGAEAATKVWNRFLAHAEGGSAGRSLSAVFPLGLAMGLSVGRAAVGNHGTETMQRLATIGGVYSEAMRLQEAMGRRVLLGGGGELNPLVAGRCLTMGRVIQDLETSNIHCQLLGGVPADAFLSAAEVTKWKVAVSYANSKNLAISRSNKTTDDGCEALTHTFDSLNAAAPKLPTVLVAAISSAPQVAVNRTALPEDDEWLYQLNSSKQRNPFLEANAALLRLWQVNSGLSQSGVYGSESTNTGNPTMEASGRGESIPARWLQYVTGIVEGSNGNSDRAIEQLTYPTPTAQL